MNMRDKFADAIVGNRAVDNWGEPRPADLELADAIIAALPDMIEPLVWDDELNQFENGLYHLFNFKSGFFLEFNGVGVACDLSYSEAKAAANAHNRAAIMATFNPPTSEDV
jgi:hypothetical protein